MANVIKIEQYYKGPLLFVVIANKDGKSLDVELSVSDFEKFIDKHNRRNWFNDASKLVSWEQYYDSKYVLKDLADYITVKEAEIEKASQSIKKIKIPDLFETFSSLFNPMNN